MVEFKLNIDPEPTQAQFRLGAATVLTVHKDGRLTLGDGLSADEATQAVAQMLVDNYALAVDERIKAQAALLAEAEQAAHEVIRMTDEITNAPATATRWAERIEERMLYLLAKLDAAK